MKDAFKSSEFIQITVSSLDLHILILQFISFNRMGLDWGFNQACSSAFGSGSGSGYGAGSASGSAGFSSSATEVTVSLLMDGGSCGASFSGGGSYFTTFSS